MARLTYFPAPWVAGDPAFPADWVWDWARGGHRGGRARVTALTELQARLAPHGVAGAAVIGGTWLLAEATRPELWRVGPWRPGADPGAELVAVGSGDAPEAWIRALVDAFLEAPDQLEPSAGPCVYLADDAVLLDASFMGRRDALVALRVGTATRAVAEELLGHRASWWLALILTAAVRSDAFWTRWDELVAQAVAGVPGPWGDPTERPVNPQEVTLGAAGVADRWARWARTALEVATVGIFMVDPDDEYVYGLGGAGTGRCAYDAGLVAKPEVPDTGFGLTAAWTVSPAFDPSGRPVVVRDLPDRASLDARLRDIGFDPDEGAGPQPTEREEAGPWVYAVQRLPESLSPSGRNLCVRLHGCTVPHLAAAPPQRRETRRDRRERVALVSRRIHDDVVRAFSEGLALWSEGLRTELLRELGGAGEPNALCRILAAWTSARAVSLWSLRGSALALRGWSLPAAPPDLTTDPDDHLDSRELRLLAAPLYPRRADIGPEGFLGWPAFEAHLGGPAENVGTLPLLRDRRPVAVLRVDGAMSLLAGHVPRRGGQGALHHHRPVRLPHHLRAPLEEVALLLALAPTGGPNRARSDWPRFVRDVCAGRVDADAAQARLEVLYAEAPTRGEAAARVGVHRNSFRRQLARLSEVLGAVPWG